MKGEIKNKYGLKWIYGQTKGNRRYLIVLAAAGIGMAVVNIGMATILKGFVDIAVGDSQIPLSMNFIAAVIFLVLEGVLSLVTAVSFRVSGARIARALYQGSEILLFDEPTANLDATVERECGRSWSV